MTAVLGGCRISLLGDIQKYPGQVPEQPDKIALSRRLGYMTSRGPFQAELFYDAVICLPDNQVVKGCWERQIRAWFFLLFFFPVSTCPCYSSN